jgi:hypothetical protein
MFEASTRHAQAACLETESRVRKSQRAERILGLVLWIGFGMTLLLFARF